MIFVLTMHLHFIMSFTLFMIVRTKIIGHHSLLIIRKQTPEKQDTKFWRYFDFIAKSLSSQSHCQTKVEISSEFSVLFF